MRRVVHFVESEDSAINQLLYKAINVKKKSVMLFMHYFEQIPLLTFQFPLRSVRAMNFEPVLYRLSQLTS